MTWTREDPPGGGPPAGLLAVAAPDVVPDGACLVDAAGRLQWLAGVYRYDALLAAAPGDQESEHGLPMRRLLLPLRMVGDPEVRLAGTAAA